MKRPVPAHPPLAARPLQTLVYENPQYAGVNLPFSIYTLAILNSLLMGGAELYRNTELDPERRCYPGGCPSPAASPPLPPAWPCACTSQGLRRESVAIRPLPACTCWHASG